MILMTYERIYIDDVGVREIILLINNIVPVAFSLTLFHLPVFFPGPDQSQH
jgi:hypothetical protein